MSKKKVSKKSAAKSSPADSSTRPRGPVICEPGSEEAKRIEKTHGFNAALKARDKRDGTAASEKGDKQ